MEKEAILLFYNLFYSVVTTINLVGITVVFWGFVVAAIAFIHLKLHHHTTSFFLKEANRIRAILGTYILFGLEFMIAADIIHTFIKPTQQDLIVLATIVAIRTVISYFLGREVEEARKDQSLGKERRHEINKKNSIDL